MLFQAYYRQTLSATVHANKSTPNCTTHHDDVIKWKHFPRYWPFVREIHRSPVNFPHKGQWRGALMFSLIYAWINDWVNNREAGDLRRQYGHYDVIVMIAIGDIGNINTLWSRHNGRHFPYDIVKWIFLNGNLGISMKISLTFVPKGPINNIHIGLDYGLAPTRRQAVIWMNDG